MSQSLRVQTEKRTVGSLSSMEETLQPISKTFDVDNTRHTENEETLLMQESLKNP